MSGLERVQNLVLISLTLRGIALKHREEEKLKDAVKTCLEADEDAVEKLENPIIKEEIRKLRSMADE